MYFDYGRDYDYCQGWSSSIKCWFTLLRLLLFLLIIYYVCWELEMIIFSVLSLFSKWPKGRKKSSVRCLMKCIVSAQDDSHRKRFWQADWLDISNIWLHLGEDQPYFGHCCAIFSAHTLLPFSLNRKFCDEFLGRCVGIWVWFILLDQVKTN